MSFEAEISESAEYLLGTQLSGAGAIILSKQDKPKYKDVPGTIVYLNSILKKIKCKRIIKEEDIVPSSGKFDNCDFSRVMKAGYVLSDYEKKFIEIKEYSSVFVMNSSIIKEKLEEKAKHIFKSSEKFGQVIRIKGFIKEDENYIFINMTKNNIELDRIERGQNILIAIGEELNENEIIKMLTE